MKSFLATYYLILIISNNLASLLQVCSGFCTWLFGDLMMLTLTNSFISFFLLTAFPWWHLYKASKLQTSLWNDEFCACTDCFGVFPVVIESTDYCHTLQCSEKTRPSSTWVKFHWSGSLSSYDGDGNENITWKMNLRCFKLRRYHITLFILSHVGEFSWS